MKIKGGDAAAAATATVSNGKGKHSLNRTMDSANHQDNPQHEKLSRKMSLKVYNLNANINEMYDVQDFFSF
jgi:hypothetical protein